MLVHVFLSSCESQAEVVCISTNRHKKEANHRRKGSNASKPEWECSLGNISVGESSSRNDRANEGLEKVSTHASNISDIVSNNVSAHASSLGVDASSNTSEQGNAGCTESETS